MKTALAVLAAVVGLGVAGCTTKGVTISQDHTRKPVAETSAITRGRSTAYRAPVTIENAQMFAAWSFQDFRNQFLLPVEGGQWRYVIEAITLAADEDQEGDWTLLIALDTGARIKLENFAGWSEELKSLFAVGYQRALRALEEVRQRDPALDRYLRFWNSKRRR